MADSIVVVNDVVIVAPEDAAIETLIRSTDRALFAILKWSLHRDSIIDGKPWSYSG